MELEFLDKINVFDIFEAYKRLKNYAYNDNTMLFLKKEIAEYECQNILPQTNEWMTNDKELKDWEDKLTKLWNPLISAINDPDKHKQYLDGIYNKIKCKIYPKFKQATKNQNSFITNEIKLSEFDDVNFYIDAPVEIHLISILWMLKVGKEFAKNNSYSYGNKTIWERDNESEEHEKYLLSIYENYPKQYSKWRDKALDCAEELHKKGKNATIVGIDIHKFYYSIDKNLDDILKTADSEKYKIINEIKTTRNLNTLLNRIHNDFFCEINREQKKYSIDSEKFSIDNEKYSIDNENLLPIGLISSGLLSNLYMKPFDTLIINKLNPYYYGRYVDDMLFVFETIRFDEKTLTGLPEEKKLKNILKIIFKDFIDLEKNTFHSNSNLGINDSKLIIWHFTKEGPMTSLLEFRKKLKQNSSELNLIPDDEFLNDNNSDSLYRNLYDGSLMKISSIKEFSTNSPFEISRLLSKVLYYINYTGETNISIINDIHEFFIKSNTLENFLLWEKVATIYVLAKRFDLLIKFNKEISKILEDERNSIIRDTLTNHLNISIALAIAVLETEDIKELEKIETFKESFILSKQFQKAVIIRYNSLLFKALPFFQKGTTRINTPISLPENKSGIRYSWLLSAYYVHLVDINILFIADNNPDSFETIKRIFKTINFSWRKIFKSKQINEIASEECFLDKLISVKDRFVEFLNQTAETDKCQLTIAITNIKLDRESTDYSNSLMNRINLNKDYDNLKFAFSQAIVHKVDLIVLPELAIPYSLVPFVINFARKYNIGVITGIDYFFIEKDELVQAHNNSLCLLPTDSIWGNECFVFSRLKRHYAPKEEEILKGLNLTIPKSNSKQKLYHWRNSYFSIYNCFELGNLKDRALYKSKVDFLVAIEYNKDTNYYSDIIGSTVRDIHCYMIQVNTSQYGDSRIICPSNSEKKDIIKVKGGQNTSVLIDKIDLKKLREFQFKNYNSQLSDKDFKPTPPSFKHENARKRYNNENLSSFDYEE